MSKDSLTSDEARLIHDALNSEAKSVNIRLREGEYQYDLAKAIAAFEMERSFPNVKDLIKKSYGDANAEDIQFVRKIQTILKKMEKSGIITILPKKQPWELQRYALSSFKFQDVDKNIIVLSTKAQIKETLSENPSSSYSELSPKTKVRSVYFVPEIVLLAVVVILSYAATLWAIVQPSINLVVFIVAFALAAACSILLGALISRKNK